MSQNTTSIAAATDNHVNPLITEFKTPHQTPPFNDITVKDFEEAIDLGIEKAQQEIRAITMQRSMPDFDNTIVALERVGEDLNRALNVFYPLLSANADDKMMELSISVSQKLSDYSTSIILNEALWQRIKQVYDNRELYNLDTEDARLLQKTYDSFALSGATLEGSARDEYKKLSAELSELTTKFGQNVLRELNTYKIWLKKEELNGLPEDVITAAAEAAVAENRSGEYLFTLAMPTYVAVMKNAADRSVREKFYKLYTSRNTKGEYSNMEILARIADVRRQIANLLGSSTYAEQNLKTTMAKNPQAVYKLLDQLKEAYSPSAQAEMKELTEYASALEGLNMELKPWDYSYYSNKLKSEKYAFDEEALRPYFELSNTVNGVFGLATKLYGLQFKENPDIQVYHPDVKAYDVTDEDGKFVGVIYTDFFPRESKRPGAWMTSFKDQFITEDGVNSRPVVTIVMNFTKPTADKPSLLTPDEVETFLHEFGHSLHGLLADTKYSSLSGTAVYRDFVELPSQFNENYLTEREFLDGFARHYQTGEPIPQELVDGLVRSARFGAAYACLRQLMFGYLDMAWHTITAPVLDVTKFEQDATAAVNVFAPVEGSLTSPQFSHIFSGGYAAGYYSYKWAEVLDADAFAKFKEDGIFNRNTADSFRKNILTRGGTEDPAILYKRFRGADPSIDALLKRDGIKE
ncbi:MAG: M3 family metallopeptidase [Muribaculaceae bacterium]|nr:M3 family metallopeptidase [Muribaculaceae bacterium]